MVKSSSVLQACRPLMKQRAVAYNQTIRKLVPVTHAHSMHTFSSTPCACASCSTNAWNGKTFDINSASRKSYTTSAPAQAENKHLTKILENNKKWVDSVNQKDPSFFPTLAKGQKPTYLYFGCSDSRVPANQIMGLG